MGPVRTTITLSNPRRDDLRSMDVDALVDTGALHVCVPARVAAQLDLEPIEERTVTYADGSTARVPYSGPVRTTFGNRSCFTGAMVLGEEVLLGAIPMEDMDLVVRPVMRDVVPNPASPNIPASIAKGFRSGHDR